MRVIVLLTTLMLTSGLLFADDHTVNFDSHTDFSTLKSFALREGKVDSPRPELNNTLVMKKIGDAIRAELLARGLKETVNSPDLVIDFHVSAEDFSENRGGPVTSSEGTLVVDMTKRDSKVLVWRGVYRDSERNNAKLAQKLPNDVKKVVSQYPPKQKGLIQQGPSTLAAAPKLSPKAAAQVALEIVKATNLDTAWVGPDAHPGLAISLGGLERAAQAVATDDGRNPLATNSKNLAFYEALNGTADYATSIASRGVETADSKQKSRNLASKLRDLTGV
jgi:hypothetical protein